MLSSNTRHSLDEIGEVFFTLAKGIGPQTVASICEAHGSLSFFLNSYHDNFKSTFPQNQALKLIRDFESFNLQKYEQDLQKQGVYLLPKSGGFYPDVLKHIPSAPLCLFARGEISLLNDTNKMIAIVGTRKPTEYGKFVVDRFVPELVNHGVITVSGLALGIDTLVHEQTIAHSGKTVAVIAGGIDHIYPRENRNLYEKIEKNGLILSEYPPTIAPNKGSFLARNRIVSGLSRAVLIVEGAKHSGTFTTARHAAVQSKEVFVVPGPIHWVNSFVPNTLLREGAIPALSPKDILDYLAISSKNKATSIKNVFTKDEALIIEAIANNSVLIDSIALYTKLPLETVLELTSLLEIQGVLKKSLNGDYTFCNQN